MYQAKEIWSFSCELRNTKTVSIWLSALCQHSHVGCRFGTKSKVELRYSSNVDRSGHKFYRCEVVYANNSEDMI